VFVVHHLFSSSIRLNVCVFTTYQVFTKPLIPDSQTERKSYQRYVRCERVRIEVLEPIFKEIRVNLLSLTVVKYDVLDCLRYLLAGIGRETIIHDNDNQQNNY
jgi:hypothetical protein